jgi:pseudaminic acid biosynthesis-associated methylase
MTDYKTDQEIFWAGEFGTKYFERNQGDKVLASNLNLFSNVLKRTNNIKSCIEFGANIGINLQALKILKPEIEQYGIEINKKAAERLSRIVPATNIFHTSILEFNDSCICDFALIKGVLIHINPDKLSTVYEKLSNATNRYLLIAEYYNPFPISIPYRGHADKLFKRDFAKEMMDQHPQFKLIDYGFIYHNDLNFPDDDITWFLMEKTNN